MTANSDNLKLKYLANSCLIDVYWDNEAFNEELLEIAIENQGFAEQGTDTVMKKQAVFDLAYAYSQLGKYTLALDTYQEAIKYQLIEGNHSVSASYNNMANIYVNLEQFDSAIHYFKKAEKEAILERRQNGVAASNFYLGQVYNKKKMHEKALYYCKKGLKIFQENDILARQDFCATCITEAYLGLGDKSSAFDALVFENAIKDSIAEKSSIGALENVKSEFQIRSNAEKDSIAFAYQAQLNQAKIEKQNSRNLFLFIGLGLTLIFSLFILNRFRITRRQKFIIEDQKREVARQHSELKETHKEITDSITYAKRIQKAILPPSDTVANILGQAFVLYEPKDVVAGDFYFVTKKNDDIFFAVADCTGHGVPGAMVSVVCNNALNRSVNEFKLLDPAKIRDQTRDLVIEEFQRSNEEVKDGMDIALCKINGRKLNFAGAHNPLWIIRDGQIIEVNGDKQPIGNFHASTPFTNHEMEVISGDIIYLFSDGYCDQFRSESTSAEAIGGMRKGKKLKRKNMRRIFLEAATLPITQQHDFLLKTFKKWMGNYAQLDDVCVMGVKVD